VGHEGGEWVLYGGACVSVFVLVVVEVGDAGDVYLVLA